MPPTLAILGAGQLGRMLALAAARLGVRCRFLDPAAAGPEPCACEGLGELIAAEFTDLGALDRLSEGADAATFEFENVPSEAVEYLSQRLPSWPASLALRTSQDRLLEKQAFGACGIPTNRTIPWEPIAGSTFDARRQLHDAIASLGFKVVIKTRRLGYDGKGQAVLREPSDYLNYLNRVEASPPTSPLLVEDLVPFTRELSIIAVRSHDGQVRCYPLVENTHKVGILRRTVAPASLPGLRPEGARLLPGASAPGSAQSPRDPGGVDEAPDLQRLAECHITTLMTRLNYVGVMALELFEIATPDGPRLLANEIAPRVHNTGHWTIEAARTSQFENHVRAVLGLPLGDTDAVGHSVMVNLIGVRPDPARVLAIPGATLHWYGKSVRPGRKVGHVTVWAETADEAAERAAAVEALL